MATDAPVQLGMVGLGRMGANLVRRAMRGRPSVCVGTDVNPERCAGARRRGDDGRDLGRRSSSRRSSRLARSG